MILIYFCVGRATADSESQRVDTTGEMLQCLCDIKVNDGWCTEGATSTFALSPLGRRYESADVRRRECEGEEAIVVSHLCTSPLYLRTFAFASSHLHLCNVFWRMTLFCGHWPLANIVKKRLLDIKYP